MDRKKEVLLYQREELFNNEAHYFSQNSYSRITENELPNREPQEGEKPEGKSNNVYDTKKKPKVDNKSGQNEAGIFTSPAENRKKDEHDSQVVPALRKKMLGISQPSYEELPLETNEKNKSQNNYIYGRSPIHSPEINQSIIPEVVNENEYTSLRKDLNDMRVLEEDERKRNEQEVEKKPMDNKSMNVSQGELFKLDPLELKVRSRLENYFEFIPEKVWQCSFSKNWKAKA